MVRPALNVCDAPAAPDSHYVDNRIYTDEDIFRDEQERIFSRVWKFVCHESEVSKLNDYRTTTVAGTPLVICRGQDGKIRTFVNACSHRGALVLREPRGNARTLECIFHRWRYDNTTGSCKTRPSEAGFADMGPKIETCGLRQVRTEIYLGLVFVNLDNDAQGLTDFLSNALELEEEILGTVELEVFDYYEHVLNTNWKNWQETNMDLYHEYMHAINRRTSMGEAAYYERKWRLYPRGHAAIERYKVRYDKQKGWQERSDHLRLPGLDPSEFQLIDIFPDLAVNARGTVIRIDSQIPLSATTTLVQYRGLAIKGVSAADRMQQKKDYAALWSPFGRNLPEDCLATELQGRAMEGERVPYSYWSRQSAGKTHDDLAMRAYYEEWARLMGRNPARPYGNAGSQ